MKLCVCLSEAWRQQWPDYIDKADLLELRIDLMFSDGVTVNQMTDTLKPLLLENSQKIVLTCRTGNISQEMRLTLFLSLLPCTPAYIDIEYDTPPRFSTPLYEAAKKNGVRVIASYHHLDTMPDLTRLRAITENALLGGADLVKIVTRCHDATDEARLLSLYREPRFAHRIIAFSLGPYALTSRLHAAASGAPILYVAPDNGAVTAPGQPRFTQFSAHLLNIY